MTDEVPVCDVLLDATEYLCKLGTNLRIRSETLKKKRISKDKLKNTHAVQKAADKILLICELSKKSLDNVESGVQKILKVCGTNTNRFAPVPSKSPKSRSNESKINYYFLQYGSRKLRISQKVSLKDYTSVKVSATKLSRAMQERYPVFYDCKLYRLRKRRESENDKTQKNDSDHGKELKKSNESTKSDEPDTGEKLSKKTNYVKERDGYGSDINTENNKKHTSMSEVQKKVKDSPISKSSENKKRKDCPQKDHKKSEKSESDSDKDAFKTKQSASDKIKIKHSSESQKEKSDSQKSDKYDANSKKTHSKKNKQKKVIFDSSDEEKNKNEIVPKTQNSGDLEIVTLNDSDDSDPQQLSKKMKLKQSTESDNVKQKVDENKKRNSESDSDNDSFETKQSVSDKHKIKHSSASQRESSDSQKYDKYDSNPNKTHSKKNKHKVIHDSSCTDEDKNKDEIVPKPQKSGYLEIVTLNDSDDSDPQQLSKKMKLSQSTESDNVKQKVDDFQEQTSNESVSQKPLLKCVDITKLMKPEAVTKTSNSSRQTNLKVKFEDESIAEKKKQDKRKQYKILEEEYWKAKRIEVKAFTAKKFNIHVCRLPGFSNHFLSSNNLKTIVQSGKVIAQIVEEKQDEVESHNNNGTETAKVDSDEDRPSTDRDLNVKNIKKASIDISNVRNELLNDSESDEDKTSSTAQSNKKKKTLDISVEDKTNNFDDVQEESSKENGHTGENYQPVNISKSNAETADVDQEATSKKDQGSEQDKSSEVEVYRKDQLSGKDNNNDGVNSDEASKKKLAAQKDCDINTINSEETPKTPRHKRKRSDSTTPKSKRKHIMESMHAKKMLLTYSSSETEDEQLKETLKEIKNSLLEGSDEEKSPDIKESMKEKHRKKLLATSSDEDEDVGSLISRKPKKKKKAKLSSEDDKETGKHESSISQMDGNMDETSNTSSKMGRSKTKPSSSGKQQTDAQDSDKDIDGLTNIKTLNKPRRRESSSAEERTTRTRSQRTLKAPAMTGGVQLEAETNSSAEDSGDNGEVDDLPPVSVSGLNGSGLQTLAKDDLLDESSSSNEDNKESDAAAKMEEESTEEENPKGRRRKKQISSDSEASAARAKPAKPAARMSDLDSDEGSDDAERRRRRRIDDSEGSDSDACNKKKRRRIKTLEDSEGSGSESETEGRKHGRKNIRKVMGKDQLEEATKKAARKEKERMARIAERQKMYNNVVFDESGKPDEVVLDQVVLDFDPETKQPLIQVDRGLVKKLKPHQANGIKFMWDACFESVKRIKKDKGSGCILAHCMGLGKTLQVVSLVHSLLVHSELTGVNRVLVVCPLSTVLNWVNEFNMWLRHSEADYEVDVYELSRFKQNSERAYQLNTWFRHGGVCVLGYEMFRNLSADNGKKFRKKMLKTFQEALVDPGPDLVVCDEGHLLKNEKTSLSQSMNRVKSLRRIVLTGTPLQNNLKEYYCMVQFVKPNLLGKYNEYLNRFVNPITNGQYTDSTERDIGIMKRRSHVLHKMLDGAVQRRDYGVLAPFLPPKHEYVLFITLTDVQTKLYQHYLDNYSRRPLPGKSSGFLFPDFQSLQRIWTHPLVLKYNSERYEIMQQKKRDKEEEEDSEGSLIDFIDDDSTGDESSSEDSSDISDMSDDSRKKKKKKKASKKSKGKEKEKEAKEAKREAARRGTRANPLDGTDLEAPAELPDEVKYSNPTEWWINMVEEDELEDLRNSHKLVLLFDILKHCEAIGDKLLVFSQSLYSLDLIEHFLGKVDEATQESRVDEKLGGHVGSWSPGIDYFRLDGSTSCENRSIWCKSFNREDNPRARLFLISTRAGGLGINLVAANRVVIFDVSWNPSHDVQSIFRVYRFGQKKPCYVYRFLAMGTMEEKIYERQVTKQAISKRVIDEQQIDRHYAENDLAELYTFEPRPPGTRPLPPLPRDRLFAEMLKEHDQQIYRYHEHDSLLENKEEETLTEAERKAAWEDFENEKDRPPPAPFPAMWPQAYNGMNASQLGQQLAYATLASMLRKDMPNVNEQQLRDMLPMIYNANPQMFGGYDYGLMQKMTEMYKYAQPGMMNPLMNVMGGGGAGGAPAGMVGGAPAGMVGGSGLAYEPPWQRQQQQQQQMRLQQLLQAQNVAQNSMGAKYYSGGLGSRDPVAMAMQQQQARQIMLGDAARGRPRGRPPGRANMPPPQPSGDVVDLDSD